MSVLLGVTKYRNDPISLHLYQHLVVSLFFILVILIDMPWYLMVWICISLMSNDVEGFPGGSVAKNPPANAGDAGSIVGQEDPLKEMATHTGYSYLKNPMDRGSWQAAVHGGHKELDTTQLLSMYAMMLNIFFMCLFVICLTSLVKCLFCSFSHWIVWCFYCWIFQVLYIFYILVLCWICGLQIFSHSLYPIFSSS